MRNKKYRRYFLSLASSNGPFYDRDGDLVQGMDSAISFGDESLAIEFIKKHDKLSKLSPRIVSDVFTEQQLKEFERLAGIYRRLKKNP